MDDALQSLNAQKKEFLKSKLGVYLDRLASEQCFYSSSPSFDRIADREAANKRTQRTMRPQTALLQNVYPFFASFDVTLKF